MQERLNAPRLLVVDDDPGIAEAMRDVLRWEGFEVELATNGAEALEVLRKAVSLPDAVLLDLWMPVMDGWAFRAEQRRDAHLSSIPVLVMTADHSAQAQAIDAAGVVQKPVDARALVHELNRILSETRARRAREHEAHTERLTSLGRLAAGMAHEINNPLAWVTANLRQIGETLPQLISAAPPDVAESPDVRELPQVVQEALQGASRIRDIVQQVRSFSQPQLGRAQVVDPLPVLDAAVKLMELQARHSVEVLRDYGAVPEVQADPTQLSQLYLNVLINAADAVGDTAVGRGTVRVSARTGPGGGAEVEVKDSGIGMSAATRQRIFEPFFTTKRVGKGTGLGLFLCHGIVTALHGTIQVESEPGQGTTVRIRLPAALQSARPAVKAPVPPAPTGAPVRRRLLVVEDEEVLARALERMLRRSYDVVLAHSVDSALQRLDEGPAFDVILCDVHMPVRGGPEFLEELEANRPALAPKTLFMSGGAITDRSQAFIERMGARVLPKPLDAAELEQAIQRLTAPTSER